MEWPYGTEVPDLYGLLGVAAGASRAEIVRAYRRKAHASHPDAQPGDPGASARFRALTYAYDVLIDPARRADYDRRRARTRNLPQPEPGGQPGQTRAWPPHPADPGSAPGPAQGPLLWAGPVHVEPPGRPSTAGQHGAFGHSAFGHGAFGHGAAWYETSGQAAAGSSQASLAEVLALLTRYLEGEWGWPR